MSSPFQTLYTDWDIYDGGWLDFDKTTPPMMKEIIECFVGPMIAQGTQRYVFGCAADPTLVVKFQKSFGQQNAVEVHIWDSYKNDPKVAKWLAPIVSHSSCNRVIVQKRTMPLLKAPTKLPQFLTDRKTANYGLIDGRVVCHDYGMLRITDQNVRMETTKWWDGGTDKYYDDGKKVIYE